MLTVIGVHSNVTGDASLTDGHAWITLHFSNGRSTSVGLWTPTLFEARRFVKDRIGALDSTAENFDVQWGLEDRRRYHAKVSRYYGLTGDQARFAVHVLGAYDGWRYTNTCATWATRVVKELTGEELASSEFLGMTNTPRQLGNAILHLEAKEPTSVSNPKIVIGNAIVGASISH